MVLTMLLLIAVVDSADMADGAWLASEDFKFWDEKLKDFGKIFCCDSKAKFRFSTGDLLCQR